MRHAAKLAALLVSLATLVSAAQDPSQLMQTPAVRAALEDAKANEPQTIQTQIHVCEIPAPSFMETKRGEELAHLFREAGLQNVRIDPAGNVLGDRPGKSAHPHLVVAAHLDTVFPEGTDVTVKHEGSVLKAPGIGDDCRGLAVMLSVIHSLNQAKVETNGTVTFVADVGEEGLGDLRGMKELFNKTMKGQIDEFVSIEPGQPDRITNGGVGSYRYRVTFKGPGGHSYGAFGNANPIHALGRAIAKISDFEVPASPKTTFNVGRIGGGTSINSIAFEAWAEVDLRSEDSASLEAENTKFKQAVNSALEEENNRWHDKGKLTLSLEQVGYRPAGHTDPSSPIVRSTFAVNKALGLPEPTLDASSSDSNVPMNLGIPAITIGGGGKDEGAHSPEESFDPQDSWVGTQRALLLTVTLTQ
jgi:acetylornithine deacetylase/succinyl-diaminopimelate desuccinylase-like protein